MVLMINTKSLDFKYKPSAHSRRGSVQDQKLSDKVEFNLDFCTWCSIQLSVQNETIIYLRISDYYGVTGL